MVPLGLGGSCFLFEDGWIRRMEGIPLPACKTLRSRQKARPMKSVLAFCVAVTCFLVLSGCTTKEGYVAKGNKLSEARKYADAVITYRKAIQKDPKFGEAYYRLGLVALKQGDAKQAYTALTRAVELLPDNDDAKEK